MAHAEGWIEAYTCLEEGRPLPEDLMATVLQNRNGIGETMLHWYAIEGAVEIVEKIIDLGLAVNVTNEFSQTPLFECVQIERWEIVELLLRRGADPYIKNSGGMDIFERLKWRGEQSKTAKLKKLIAKSKLSSNNVPD